MSNTRKSVALVGVILLIPIIILLATFPGSSFTLHSTLGFTGYALLGYAVEISAASGVILLLLSWLAVQAA